MSDDYPPLGGRPRVLDSVLLSLHFWQLPHTSLLSFLSAFLALSVGVNIEVKI